MAIVAHVVSIRVHIFSIHLSVAVGLTPTRATKTIRDHDSLSAAVGAGVLVIDPWVSILQHLAPYILFEPLQRQLLK
jgi:hypothetical protein